jgi:hypothetical protein
MELSHLPNTNEFISNKVLRYMISNRKRSRYPLWLSLNCYKDDRSIHIHQRVHSYEPSPLAET